MIATDIIEYSRCEVRRVDKELMLQIGKRLRKQREKLNMIREEFAEKAGISPQFLAEIENGKKGMSSETLYKICENFNLSADYILLGRIASDRLSSSGANTLNLLSEPYISYAEDILEIVDRIVNKAQKQ